MSSHITYALRMHPDDENAPVTTSTLERSIRFIVLRLSPLKMRSKSICPSTKMYSYESFSVGTKKIAIPAATTITNNTRTVPIVIAARSPNAIRITANAISPIRCIFFCGVSFCFFNISF